MNRSPYENLGYSSIRQIREAPRCWDEPWGLGGPACDLVRGHVGPHHCQIDLTSDDAFTWPQRGVYVAEQDKTNEE